MHPSFQRIRINVLFNLDVVLFAVQVELVEKATFDPIRHEVTEMLMIHIDAVEVIC